jgi:cell division septation protein DedD
MTIEFQCECGRTLRAPEGYAGRKGRCPACQKWIIVPETTSVLETLTGSNGAREDASREERGEESFQQGVFDEEEGTEGVEGTVEEQLQGRQQGRSWSRSPWFLILASCLVVLLVALIGFIVVRQEKQPLERVVAVEEVTPPSEESQNKDVHPTGIELKGEMNRLEETLPIKSLLTPETEEPVTEISEFEKGETVQEVAQVKEETERMALTLRPESTEKADRPSEGTQKTTLEISKVEEDQTEHQLAERKVAAPDERPESIPLPEGNQRTMPETSMVEEEETGQEVAETKEDTELESTILGEEKPESREGPGPLPGGYTVNIASFREKARADRFVGELKEKGLEAFCWEIDLPEKGKWYRVAVGNFPTLEYAKNFIVQEGLKENYSVFITRDPGA